MLRAQAERLLMVLPGTYTDTPIRELRRQIEAMYDFDVREQKRMLPIQISEREQRLMHLMLSWIGTYEWVSMLSHTDPAPDPAMFGIMLVSTRNFVTTIMTYCHNYEHFKMIPLVITYDGKRYGKTGWDSDTKRCYHRNNAPVAMGAC